MKKCSYIISRWQFKGLQKHFYEGPSVEYKNFDKIIYSLQYYGTSMSYKIYSSTFYYNIREGAMLKIKPFIGFF